MTRNVFYTLPALLLIFVLWITPGLFGRDPWKADEPYTVGLVSHIVRTGDWVVPTLTGEPFLEKPPLVFLTAAGFARVFSPPLELYDAARLATAFFMLLAFLFFALTARELYGGASAGVAAFLLLGCVHLQVTAHKLITDVGLFAGFSVALYGLALSRRRTGAGGFWLGTGTGIAFLSKGLLAPGVIGIASLALPFLFPRWRRRGHAWALTAALAAALPWLVIWPAALYHRSPALFERWFWVQNFGRFLGFEHSGIKDSHSYYIMNLLWLALPVVLPAGWVLWRLRRSWRDHPLFQVPLIVFLVTLGVLSASSTNRSLYAVPLLLPVALMAVPAIDLLPARVLAAANRTSVLLFGGVSLLLWFGWTAMMTGFPAAVARRIHAFQPDYVPSVNGLLLALAVLYSLVWLVIVLRATRPPEYAVVNWGLGVVLAWGLIMTLWLPALNSGSSYRAAFTSLKRSLPEEYSCIASRGLGESERAMLEYYAGLRTRRIEASGPGKCDLLLEQRAGRAAPAISGAWREIWEFRHPSERPKDIFTLYRKTGS